MFYQKIKRGRAVGGDKENATSLLKAAVAMLLEAEQILLAEAHGAGWLGTCPLTYKEISNNLMGPDIKPALRCALNGSPLPIRPFQIPVDGEDVWAPSPLACLYYVPVLVLCDVRLQLAEVLLTLGPLYSAPSKPEEPEVTGGDEDGDELQVTDWTNFALEKVAEGLATLRHTAHPPGCVRAGLLLALGQLRLALLRGSAPARLHASGPESEDPENTELDAVKKDFESTSLALMTALRISCSAGGHDFVTMRKAAYYLAMLYGHSFFPGEEERHLQISTHFLRLAAEISSKHRTFQNNIAELASEGALSEVMTDSLPSAVLQELPDIPTPRTVLHLLASTTKEKTYEVMEWNLYHKQCLIHQALRDNYAPYADGCCVVIDELPEEKPMLQSGLVCIQWQIVCEQSDHRLDAEKGLFSRIQAMMLLGGGPEGSGSKLAEVFGEDPYLTKIDLRAVEAQDIQRNISDLLRQCRVLKQKTKGDEFPPYIISHFQSFLRKTGQILLHESNAELDESTLNDCISSIPCTEDSLFFFQKAFDTQNGINEASQEVCLFFRTVLEGRKQNNAS